ncbi:MAG TPA: pentapeptide repeat-containing protein [Cyanobacteria bacterium UBA8530]|nr:pentapeptide repeat-containing protein [Cyanobacteria bacterium UBA8530]
MRSKSVKYRNKIQAPDLPSNLAFPLFPPECLEKGGHLGDLALSEWVASGQSAEALTLEFLLIERSVFSGTSFRRLKLRDARLLKCDLSNADWSYAAFDRVEFLEGRLTGLKAIEAKFRDILFAECKADLALFRYASFRDVRFDECNLREADFLGADLRGVSFYGCDLQGANFSGAKLELADFRGARLEGIVLQPADLKGLIIDSDQAIALSGYFAQLLGMTVLESK